MLADLSPRPYQAEGFAGLRRLYAVERRRAPVYVLPTGGGKTFVFSMICEAAAARGTNVLINVHRQELLIQASAALDRLGLHHGLIAPGYRSTSDPIQIGMVQTMARRRLTWNWKPGLIIIDEAHHAVAGTWARIIGAYPDAMLLGVTATPTRTDGRGLGEVFDSMLVGPSIGTLIAGGYLVRPRRFVSDIHLDFSAIRKRGADLNPDDQADMVDRPNIIGDAVEHYREHLNGAPSIAFCCNVKHAEHVAENFRRNGFRSICLDGSTEDKARRQALRDLESGAINVVTSADLISEGVDVPGIHGALLLRRTDSVSLFLQQVGRALRPAPGKTSAIILDHVGNSVRHGAPEADRVWTLDGKDQGRVANEKEKDDDAPRDRQCPQCYAWVPIAPKCAVCGKVFDFTVLPREAPGVLLEIQPSAEDQIRLTIERRRRISEAETWDDLCRLEKDYGYKPGWKFLRAKIADIEIPERYARR